MHGAVDPGSFRDRKARVFLSGGRVFRALSQEALEDWKALSATSFFQRAVDDGRIIPTRVAEVAPDEFLGEPESEWVALLEHDLIPFVSYPYEWSFSMLRDAALLHLGLLLEALSNDLILKDSSAYNIQWLGSRPTHIDISSFQRLPPGEPWVGYLQFCQLFLYPLLLAAYKDLPFQPWLRGAIDGITPADCHRMMSLRDHIRPGVMGHVCLQSKLQSRSADSKTSMRSILRGSGFTKSITIRNAKALTRIIERLRWRRSSSEWSSYADTHSYSSKEEAEKRKFVRRAAASRRWTLAWDLGCNVGLYSRIVADHADTVIAMDGDELAIDRFYGELRTDGGQNVLPLVMNLADPSPNLGWRGRERRALTARGDVDLTLCLALIHHMVISANVPLAEFIDWLADLGSHLVIEFVTKDDQMVKKLLLNKDDTYHDYDLENFERCIEQRFATLDSLTYHDRTRVLYFLKPKQI